MTEIILAIIVFLQMVAIVGLVFYITSTKLSINQPLPFTKTEDKKPVVNESFSAIDLPTAEQLEEDNKPQPVKEAEDAMRDIFKKLLRR